MMRMAWSIVVVMAAAGALWAGPAEKRWDETWGARAKAAAATPDKKDDVALAREILDSARAEQDKAYQTLLCRKAFDLAMADREGFATAKDASRLMQGMGGDNQIEGEHRELDVFRREYQVPDKDPSKPAAAKALYDKLLEVAQRRAPLSTDQASGFLKEASQLAAKIGAAAPAEVEARLADVADRQATLKRVDQLRNTLRKTPPDPQAAAEIIPILLARLDAADEAGKYAPAIADAAPRRIVSLAMRHPATLTPAMAMDAGDWFRAQAAAGAPWAKAAASARAAEYYEWAAKSDGAVRAKAAAALDEMRKSLPANTSQRPRPALVDLLGGLDTPTGTLEGNWTAGKDGLSCDASDIARVRLPYQPTVEYDLYIEFTRQEGEGPIAIMLSQEKRNFQWVMSMGEQSAFETAKGKAASDPANTTRSACPITNGQRHLCVVQVRKNWIAAHVDDRMVCRYDVALWEMQGGSQWPAGREVLGLGAAKSKVTFHSVRIMEMAGEGKKPPTDRVVNLLPLVVPAKDIMHGAWRMEKEELIANVGMDYTIRLPYEAPDEYDFRVECTPREPKATVALIAWRYDRAFDWLMCDGSHLGFELIGNQSAAANPTTVNGDTASLKEGQRHKCVLQVRRNTLTAIVDGKRVAQWHTDGKDLRLPDRWPAGGRTLGLGASGSAVVFHSVDVVEVNGEGRVQGGNR